MKPPRSPRNSNHDKLAINPPHALAQAVRGSFVGVEERAMRPTLRLLSPRAVDGLVATSDPDGLLDLDPGLGVVSV